MAAVPYATPKPNPNPNPKTKCKPNPNPSSSPSPSRDQVPYATFIAGASAREARPAVGSFTLELAPLAPPTPVGRAF